MGNDYYEILGVATDATLDDIKQGYKNLAKKWHPDKPEGSAETFKKLSVAYKVLSNEKTRKAYDRRLSNSASTFTDRFSRVASVASSTAKKVMNDIADEAGLFETIDKFLGRKKEAKNVEVSLKISIEELYDGDDKQVVFKRRETCHECSGKGAKNKADIKTCDECYGLGQQMSNIISLFTKEDCSKCKGTGRLIKKKCKKCRGKGDAKYQRDFTFTIPNDLSLGKDKDKLVLPEEGEHGGDLLITINLKLHKFYEVRWPDLYLNIPIGFHQAILGDHLQIDTLRGNAVFKVPPGTQHGDSICLPGYGLRKLVKGNPVFGDLHIIISIPTPKRINKNLRKLLEDYKLLERNRKVTPNKK